MCNDSDLAEPIRIVNERFAPVGVYRPNRRHSARLQAVANLYRPIFEATLRRAHFRDQIGAGTAALICKPAGW